MISIVIPMFNASEFIGRTIGSCLSQTYLPKEIILVDDCSTDDSVKVVSKYIEEYEGSVKIILEVLANNSGPSKVRNRAWNLASERYVSFLDADDRFLPEKLEVMHSFLERENTVVLLGHEYGIDKIDESSESEYIELGVKDFLKKNYFTTSAVIVKREIEERFDETMRYTEDQDLFLRVTQKYNKTYYLNQELVLRDREMNEEGGLSGNRWAMRKGEMKMYYKYCKSNSIMILFPLFAAYSLSKHTLKMLKG